MPSIMRSLSLCATLAVAYGNPAPTPAPTPAPGPWPTDALVARSATKYYTTATTSLPQDEYYIGMGATGTGANDNYWVACLDNPFSMRSGYAGCGYNDIYTRCSSNTAYGLDGNNLICPFDCVTNKIFADTVVTSFTPLLGCGAGTLTMNLLREITSQSSPTITDPVESTADPTTATSEAITTTTGSSSASVTYGLPVFSVQPVVAVAWTSIMALVLTEIF